MNFNNNEVREMKTPFLNLKQKKNNPSKPYLMLAELIDNSIGSWVMGGQTGELTVRISLDFRNGVITVEDNAYGMDSKELLDSVELNNEKTGNVLNMFGVGMKNAAFWFGKDLTINTNNGKEINSTSVLLSNISEESNEGWKKPITWHLEKASRPRSQGTFVKIGNVYPDRFLTQKELENTINILEIKYRQYLSRPEGEKVNILVKHTSRKGVSETFALEPNPTIAQIIALDKIELFRRNIQSNIPGKEDILIGAKEKVLDLAEKGLPLEFEHSIPFNGKEISFKLGIISQAKVGTNDAKHFKTRYGITAFQKDRAIRISGVNAIKFGPDYTRTNIKRAYGFVELGDIFRPDNNKQDFDFGSFKQEFFTIIKKIGKDMLAICDAVFDAIGNGKKINVGTSKMAQQKLQTSINAKSSGFSWKIGGKGAQGSFVDPQKNKWTFTISETSSDDPEHEDYFINAKLIDGIDRKVSIIYNVNHLIWKPLANDNSSIDMKSVTYPLVAILGLAHIGISENLIQHMFGQVKNKQDYLSAIASLAKIGLKVE